MSDRSRAYNPIPDNGPTYSNTELLQAHTALQAGHTALQAQWEAAQVQRNRDFQYMAMLRQSLKEAHETIAALKAVNNALVNSKSQLKSVDEQTSMANDKPPLTDNLWVALQQISDCRLETIWFGGGDECEKLQGLGLVEGEPFHDFDKGMDLVLWTATPAGRAVLKEHKSVKDE